MILAIITCVILGLMGISTIALSVTIYKTDGIIGPILCICGMILCIPIAYFCEVFEKHKVDIQTISTVCIVLLCAGPVFFAGILAFTKWPGKKEVIAFFRNEKPTVLGTLQPYDREFRVIPPHKLLEMKFVVLQDTETKEFHLVKCESNVNFNGVEAVCRKKGDERDHIAVAKPNPALSLYDMSRGTENFCRFCGQIKEEPRVKETGMEA